MMPSLDASPSLSYLLMKSSGKRDLIDVAIDLLAGHPDAVVGDGDGLGVAVERDVDAVGVVLNLRLRERDETLELGDGVRRVGDGLADKNILVRVQPSFDDGKNVFGLYGKRTLFGFHSSKPLSFFLYKTQKTGCKSPFSALWKGEACPLPCCQTSSLSGSSSSS